MITYLNDSQTRWWGKDEENFKFGWYTYTCTHISIQGEGASTLPCELVVTGSIYSDVHDTPYIYMIFYAKIKITSGNRCCFLCFPFISYWDLFGKQNHNIFNVHNVMIYIHRLCESILTIELINISITSHVCLFCV